ncbi:MAG: ECF transporter S component, partial [Clostridia bacterium]|nr:ECF transporter S component [Clostridia bacterium]
MSKSRSKRNADAMFNLTRCGLLSAMAVILFYIEIPVVAFYKLDLSTLPAILAGFAMGPMQGIAVIIVKNLVHMLGTSTACVGEFADILMSCAFVIPASLIYRRHKSRKGALEALRELVPGLDALALQERVASDVLRALDLARKEVRADYTKSIPI